MGNLLRKLFGKKSPKVDNDNENEDANEGTVFNQYGDDVQDAANLALAMQQEDNTTNYELTLSCEGLPKMDALSLTDPMVVVYIETKNGYKEVGKTEVINNTLSPKFSKSFIISYNTDFQQKIKFEAYDVDNEKEKDDLRKQEPIGYLECLLKEIILTQGESYMANLTSFNKKKKKKKIGKIKIKAFESDIGQSKVWFVFGVEDFITRNFIRFSISGSTNNKEYFKIHDSPKVKNTTKGCTFPKFSVNSNKISDESSNMKFEFYEVKKSSNKLLGELEISLVGLYNASNKKINIYKNNLIVGKLKVLENIKEKKNTFLNYIYEGYCLKLITAFDLTNKEHRFIRTRKNKINYVKNYCKVMETIGKYLKYYDDDHRIVSFGFGVKLPPYHNIISHNFALNGNFFNPCVQNLDSLTEKLKDTENEVEKSGPVLFSEIMSYSMNLARHFKQHNKKQYIVLLILTDGDVADVQMTLDLIKQAEELPISVLAVGIGESDFRILDQLKNDINDMGGIKNEKDKRERNVFHYIKYNEFKETEEKLANATFSEIPRQFLEYMKIMNINPKKSKGSKSKWSKKEIRRKLEGRKRKNLTREHPVVAFLEPRKEKFIKSFEPLGYNKDMIEEIINRGISAHSFNLMTEIISKLEQKKIEKENQPIHVRALMDGEMMSLKKDKRHLAGLDEELGISDESSESKEYSSEDVEDIMDNVVCFDDKNNIQIERNDVIRRKILPEKIQVFTKDEIPFKKSEEWMKMKNETHTRTQKLLLNIEENEMQYLKKKLPDCLLPEDKPFKLKERGRDKQKRNKKLSEESGLLPMLEKEKTRYDKFFGSESLEKNYCLKCRKKPISIIFMNCGHMVICESCINKINSKCLICNNEILKMIRTVVDKKAELKTYTNEDISHIDEDLSMSMIKEDQVSDSEAIIDVNTATERSEGETIVDMIAMSLKFDTEQSYKFDNSIDQGNKSLKESDEVSGIEI